MRAADFVRWRLGVTLWERQAEVVDSIAWGSSPTFVSSGHKTGMTRAAVCTALWWAACEGPCIVTSSSERHLDGIVWRDLLDVLSRSGAEGVERLGREVRFPSGRRVRGIPADRVADVAAGVDRALFVVDEAHDVPLATWLAIDAARRACRSRVLVVGKRHARRSWFTQAYAHAMEDTTARCIRVDATASPNVRSGVEDLIPGLATAAWVREVAEEWGETSDLYRTRVRGLAPSPAFDRIEVAA